MMRAVATETTQVIFRRLLVTTTMLHRGGWAGPVPGRWTSLRLPSREQYRDIG